MNASSTVNLVHSVSHALRASSRSVLPRSRGCWAAAGLLLLLVGCDAAPGPRDLDARPPLLTDFSYTPAYVLTDQLPPEQRDGERLRLPVTFRVSVDDVDGDVDRLAYLIRSPIAGREPVLEGSMHVLDGRAYDVETELVIPAAEVGRYTLLVYAYDEEGLLSNEMRGSIDIRASGGPPEILSVEAPDTLARPAASEPAKTLKIVAVVTDPDGLANISRVEFWNVNNPAAKIRLYDDGEAGNGDEVAGDGHYTRTIQITSANQPGTNTFAFQALDLTGLASEIVEKQITVE